MMSAEARHICPAVHAAESTCDWLNWSWQLGDWPSADELGEQVFASVALTEASVRLYAPPRLNGTQQHRPSTVLCVCFCVCVSAYSAQMGLIETTRGLLPGAGKTNRGRQKNDLPK